MSFMASGISSLCPEFVPSSPHFGHKCPISRKPTAVIEVKWFNGIHQVVNMVSIKFGANSCFTALEIGVYLSKTAS